MRLRRPVSTCAGLGLAAAAAALAGAFALRASVAAKEPSLVETPPISAPAAAREGLPDLWPELEAAASLLQPEPMDLLEALATEGLLSPEQLFDREPRAEALAAIRALATESGTVVVPMPDTLNGPLPDLLPLQQLCQAWLVEAWDRASRGDTTGATEDMLGVLRTGHTVGLSLERLALTELRELLVGPAREVEPALELAADALAAPLDDGALARSLAAEIELFERHFEQLGPGLATTAPPWSWLPGAYDADQTVAWVRVDGQALVDRALAPRWLRPEAKEALRWSETGGSLGQRVHNPIGRRLYTDARPELGDLIDRADRVRAQARVLQAWVAIRRVALRTGDLPQSLEAAVPGQLAAVPTDPYDGEPIRMEDSAVFSAGHGAAEWTVPSGGRQRGKDREPLQGLRIPLTTSVQPLLVEQKVDVELLIGRSFPVPGLNVVAGLLEGRRGHTRSGGTVTSGVVRLQHGDQVVEHAYDQDGPFDALGVRWAVWGGGRQLSAYPEGAPITP
jgi:hypothetical protein